MKLKALALSAGIFVAGFGLISAASNSDTKPVTTATKTEVAAAPTTPVGWNTTGTRGIYWKWCDTSDRCDTSKVIGSNRYVNILVWCKDRSCGDIYGRVNLLGADGRVVGWTNDTAYGSKGDTVQLTFDSYQQFESAKLTTLNFR